MPLTPYEVSKIFELYGLCDRNCAEISRQLKEKFGISISSVTVRNYLKQERYELNPWGGRRVALDGGGGALSDEEIEEAVRDHERFHGCARLAARYSEFSHGTYRRCWRLRGLPVRKGSRIKSKELEAILEKVD